MKIIKKSEQELTTKQLTEMLIEREGVSALEIEPEETVTMKSSKNNQTVTIDGPAILVINKD